MVFKEKILHHYSPNVHNENSAKVIIPMVLEFLKVKSVIDIGCGLAQWLKVFQNFGIEKIMGVDGSHVTKNDLLIKAEFFTTVDLNNITASSEKFTNLKFDLVLCLEVAEHLDPSSSESLVDFITSCGDNVLFSAAIPFQTGENHHNEQNYSYWSSLFERKGYVFLDPFREKLWNDERVSWWYRQNMFLVVKKDSELCSKFNAFNGNTYIHPKLLEMYVNNEKLLRNELVNNRIKKFFRNLFTKPV